MKQLLSFIILYLSLGFVQAQIGEVKVNGNQAQIYDENGRNTNFYVSLNAYAKLADYNSKYIVIEEGNQAKIYDSKGNFTFNYVPLCNKCTVLKVTNVAILVKEYNMIKYYDFQGRFTNKYTTE